jgi:hypothetical protein
MVLVQCPLLDVPERPVPSVPEKPERWFPTWALDYSRKARRSDPCEANSLYKDIDIRRRFFGNAGLLRRFQRSFRLFGNTSFRTITAFRERFPLNPSRRKEAYYLRRWKCSREVELQISEPPYHCPHCGARLAVDWRAS